MRYSSLTCGWMDGRGKLNNKASLWVQTPKKFEKNIRHIYSIRRTTHFKAF